MSAIHLAAALVSARHSSEGVQHTLIEGLREADDREETLVEVVGLLVGLLHGAGHLSTPVAMLLEVFTNVPAAASQFDEQVHVVKIDDVDSSTVTDMFDNVTEGTTKDDRVWSARMLPGGVHAVVLEGSGFSPRYVAVLGGDHDQVESLRGQFAAKDGR